MSWENHSWKYLSLIGDERVMNLQRAQRSTSFQILYCVLVRYSRTNNQTVHGKTDWTMEFEWNIFPGFNTPQISEDVKSLLLRLGETPENFTGRILFMLMFNDISCGSRDNEKECESNANLVSLYAKRLGAGTMVISWSWFREEVVLHQ